MKAKAIYLVQETVLLPLWFENFNEATEMDVIARPPAKLDGSHISEFVWFSGPCYGDITNTRPGSTFKRFSFVKTRQLGITLVVGAYW